MKSSFEVCDAGCIDVLAELGSVLQDKVGGILTHGVAALFS